jgi:site-specific recombinase XerD
MSDVHNIDREFELNNKKLQNFEHVSKANKKSMADFVDECHPEDVGKVAIRKYISNFHTMLKMMPKDFELTGADKDELKKLISKANRSNYAAATKKGYKVAVKKFYKSMEEADDHR